jgi:enoyl-CoA hydratase/carnithine racemase
MPADTLLQEAEAFAAKLASGPTLGYGGIKALVRAYQQGGIAGADAIATDTCMKLATSEDAKAAQAVLRAHGFPFTPPSYTGR